MSMYQQLLNQAEEDQRELVRLDRREDRVTLTLTDPEHLNPLSAGLNLQLLQRLEEIARDASIRSVVLTGEDPAFCAGGDLKMISSGNRAIRDSAEDADTSD